MPTARGGGGQDGQGEAAGGAADQTAGEWGDRTRSGIYIDMYRNLWSASCGGNKLGILIHHIEIHMYTYTVHDKCEGTAETAKKTSQKFYRLWTLRRATAKIMSQESGSESSAFQIGVKRET